MGDGVELSFPVRPMTRTQPSPCTPNRAPPCWNPWMCSSCSIQPPQRKWPNIISHQKNRQILRVLVGKNGDLMWIMIIPIISGEFYEETHRHRLRRSKTRRPKPIERSLVPWAFHWWPSNWPVRVSSSAHLGSRPTMACVTVLYLASIIYRNNGNIVGI